MKQTWRWMVKQALLSLVGALVSASPGLASQAEKTPRVLALKVEPTAIVLANARDARRIVVSGRRPDGSWIDLTRAAQFTAPAGLVRLDREGYFAPAKAGRGQIEVSA